jgi:hypothetical protein
MMTALIDRASTLVREFAARFVARRDAEPIDTVSVLADYTRSRAAFIAQKKLYGYLKTRMGTQWPVMFDDEVFVGSINVAKAHVFAACLADLSVYAAASAGQGNRLDRTERIALATHIQAEGVAANDSAWPAGVDGREWRATFAERVEDVNWENIVAGGDCFTESPKALVKWAPIAPELKKYDAEIVRNSMKYAWIEIRQKLRHRLVAEAVAADWKAGGR